MARQAQMQQRSDGRLSMMDEQQLERLARRYATTPSIVNEVIARVGDSKVRVEAELKARSYPWSN